MSCLILDLDHTLIHSVRKNKDKIGNPEFVFDDYHVYTRPYLRYFLNLCFNVHDKVILWSAGDEIYVNSIMCGLGLIYYPFYTIITRDTYNTVYKDVSLLPFNNILFLDDMPEHILNLNKENIIQAKPFYHVESDDCFLKCLGDIMSGLVQKMDISEN